MSTLYDYTKKHKNINNISNFTNTIYNNKISSNSGYVNINKSFNTTDSFKSEFKKKNILNSTLTKNKENIIINYDSKYTNDNNNISSDKTKPSYESPKIKILKIK